MLKCVIIIKDYCNKSRALINKSIANFISSSDTRAGVVGIVANATVSASTADAAKKSSMFFGKSPSRISFFTPAIVNPRA